VRYTLLIYGEEPTTPPSQEQVVQVGQMYEKFTSMLRDNQAYLGGDALQPTTTATTVRVRDGATLTTDGPFAETKEALVGFYLVEAKDLDEALMMAANVPGAQWGSIEVRPVFDVPTN
jgi:hypothetical protein